MSSVESYAFIITFILGGVVLIGSFVIAVILGNKSLGVPRFLLAITLLGLIQQLITYMLFTTQLIIQWPHLLGLGYPLIFLVGPCFYFFVRSYRKPEFQFKLIHLFHLLPFFLFTFLSFPLYLSSAEEKMLVVEYYYNILPDGPVTVGEWLKAGLHHLLILIYAFMSWVYLFKNDQKNARLLKRIAILLVFLALAEVLLQTGFLLTGASAVTTEIVLSGIMSVTILVIGFWIVDLRQISPLPPSRKYKTSPLSSSSSAKIKTEILHYLGSQEAYLNPSLKIADLASAIGYPAHHVSQVLGEQMNTNFYDIINRYRVEKAQELLQSDRLNKISVQAIGQECGFSSKTSFYRAFKKVTNMTPMQFVRQNI